MNPLWRRPLAALALLALSCWAGAASYQTKGAAVVPVVYPATPQGWGQALSLPNVLSQTPGFDPAKTASLAPIAHELGQSLHYTPEAFTKLAPEEQAAAVHLAYDQAKQDIMQKVYELVGQSKNLVWNKDSVSKENLDALYPLAMKLREIDKNYGGFLEDTEREIVSVSAAQTAASWRDARAAFVAKFGEATKKALETGKGEDRLGVDLAERGSSPAKTVLMVKPSRTAENLLERMRATKAGWGQSDFETLFLGYGFTYREGSDHRRYYHPQAPHLIATVGRHGELKAHYSRSAVKVLDELMVLATPISALSGATLASNLSDELPPPLDESYFPRKKDKTPPNGIPVIVASLDGAAHTEKKAVAIVERQEEPAPTVTEPVLKTDPTKLQPATEIAKTEPTETQKSLETTAFTPEANKPAKPAWWKLALDKLLRRNQP